ncbi:metallophosphoesterase family protein [Thiorhodovibrio litoralis]|uniref:metallophosphoesterase family protein n=1 Tax=Thiorhodovibrio litoralis TaxID=2952932 RepID=UPI002B25F271|nr:metallophosphoesterase family protein [Thiorhodovibrio litoralis]
MRIYAIGDVHGRADLLKQLVGLVAGDATQHSAQHRVLILLGDYIDRGPQSAEVLEYLSSAGMPLDEYHFLLGNHEQMLLGFLQDPLGHAYWLEYGGLATLGSYGVAHRGPDPDALIETAASLAAALPAHQRAFLEQLEYSCRFGDYFFAHAGIRPGVSPEEQDPRDLIWIRDTFLQHRKAHPLMVVHGHQALEEIDVRSNRIGIDTGAYANGRLTCLVLDGTARWIVDTVLGEFVSLAS